MKSVDGIRKITSSMKLVAAARVRQSQNRLEFVRAFQKGISGMWPTLKKEKDEKSETKEKILFVPITADRGLCGAANASVVRRTRALAFELRDKGVPFSIIPVGMKGRNGLTRFFPDRITQAFNETGKVKAINFRLPSMLADHLLKENCDEYVIVYNWFRNLLVYESREDRIPNFEKCKTQLLAVLNSKYEVESGGYADTLRNFYEYRFAVRLFHMMQETGTVEIAARMNAMGNSSKAAQDLLTALRKEYNRTRQAKITTELVEIVSGALFGQASS